MALLRPAPCDSFRANQLESSPPPPQVLGSRYLRCAPLIVADHVEAKGLDESEQGGSPSKRAPAAALAESDAKIRSIRVPSF